MFDGLSGELLKYEIGKFVIGLGLFLVGSAIIIVWWFGNEIVYRFKEWWRSRGR